MIKNLTISGFRGFGEAQTIDFAMPNKAKEGSGLTIITGANNSGKTTIIESIRAFNGSDSPSFSEGRRNHHTGGKISLQLTDEEGKTYSITSLDGNGSSTKKNGSFSLLYYVLPSRRAVSFEFGKHLWDRDQYIGIAQTLNDQRESSLSGFEARIFQIESNKTDFDSILKRILGSDFQWAIDRRDTGNYYIKYIKEGITHSSEGVGDGIWSIFTICAALFDAKDNDVIVIDEPELSVHPSLQKKLMSLFLEFSKNHQIIICTHSPYFVNWNAIINGAQLIRVAMEEANSKCYSISDYSRTRFDGFLRDLNNPHTLGIEANEAFFLEDRIILVEGQEDVVIFNKMRSDLNLALKGDFFGWGVGGAPKMEAFLMLFRDLGYKHVIAILDGDKSDMAQDLESKFQEYQIITLKTDDIRDKKERMIQSKEGITDKKGNFKEKYRDYIIELFNKINAAFS